VSALEVGTIVAEQSFPLTRDALVRYAGASGDFNPIHYRDDIAASVGLPGVLAHGMLTMGFAVQPVVDWLGDPGKILDYQVKFTRPVIVDPELGAAWIDPGHLRLVLANLVGNASEAMLGGGRVVVETSRMSAPTDTDGLDFHPPVPPGEYVSLAVVGTS